MRPLLLLRRPIGGLASPLGTVGWSCADKNSALLAPGELHRYRDIRRHSVVEDSAAAKLLGIQLNLCGVVAREFALVNLGETSFVRPLGHVVCVAGERRSCMRCGLVAST